MTSPAARVPSPDREQLIRLLGEHRFIWRFVGHDGNTPDRCSCGEIYGDELARDYEPAHRAHVADMLLASEALTQIRAEAWDKCEEALHDFTLDPFGDRPPNPYRLTDTGQLQQHDQPDV